jgi:glycosyltransferase involved in cell wall biosynthesis
VPRHPRISVVTSSYNQGQFIESTIQSVLAQNYPDLEHIVVDGMSTDGTPEVLARYPHLRVIREPDTGQADAINKGFRAATGDILCFLNSDDTFEPGALSRVVQEIDPARGRHVVMGRCRFIDEAGRFTGIEHPSAFESHRRVLEIWKGHFLPQPAVFWTREVWDRCGPLLETAFWLDYDLFCRFSKHYVFHPIDQVLANYRLHTDSKTASASDQQRLEAAIGVSRHYWGPMTSSRYWRILLSYGHFRLNRRQRARDLLVRGRELWRQSSRLRAIPTVLVGTLLGPDLIVDVAVMPVVKPQLWRMLARRRDLPRLWRRPSNPHTLAWRDFVGLHADGWAGPTLVQPVELARHHTALEIVGTVALGRLRRPLELELWIAGKSLGKQAAGTNQQFAVQWTLEGIAPGRHEVRIVADQYAVPHHALGNQDFRPLSFRLEHLRLAPDAPTARARDSSTA